MGFELPTCILWRQTYVAIQTCAELVIFQVHFCSHTIDSRNPESPKSEVVLDTKYICWKFKSNLRQRFLVFICLTDFLSDLLIVKNPNVYTGAALHCCRLIAELHWYFSLSEAIRLQNGNLKNWKQYQTCAIVDRWRSPRRCAEVSWTMYTIVTPIFSERKICSYKWVNFLFNSTDQYNIQLFFPFFQKKLTRLSRMYFIVDSMQSSIKFRTHWSYIFVLFMSLGKSCDLKVESFRLESALYCLFPI